MPIIIPKNFRPIEIAIVNLMPTKIETENQFLRLLGNTPLQTNVTFIRMESHKSKNISEEHLRQFYKTYNEIKEKKFDGMIITGAPVENLEFENVDYWQELTQIMDYADKNMASTIYICWGAQAGLYHHYDIKKYPLPSKLSGIYENFALVKDEPLLKDIDDKFYIPFSRYTVIDENAVAKNSALCPLAASTEAGLSIIKSTDNKKFFLLGHSEYDKETLKNEYLRDIAKGLDIQKPVNYFIDGNLNKIDVKWKITANLLFYNWLNLF